MNIYDALGIAERLPELEERALTEMLQGFHRLLRFFHLGMRDGAQSAGSDRGNSGDTDDLEGTDEAEEPDEK